MGMGVDNLLLPQRQREETSKGGLCEEPMQMVLLKPIHALDDGDFFLFGLIMEGMGGYTSVGENLISCQWEPSSVS